LFDVLEGRTVVADNVVTLRRAAWRPARSVVARQLARYIGQTQQATNFRVLTLKQHPNAAVFTGFNRIQQDSTWFTRSDTTQGTLNVLIYTAQNTKYGVLAACEGTNTQRMNAIRCIFGFTGDLYSPNQDNVSHQCSMQKPSKPWRAMRV